MSYDFELYRAAPGLGALSTWDREHREPLGRADEVRARIAARFPTLAWEADRAGRWRAHGADEDGAPREVRIPVEEDGGVLYVIAYAGPRVLRGLMDAIGATYCYAAEEMRLRDVDGVDEDWRPLRG